MSHATFTEKKHIIIKAFDDVSPKIKITHMAPTKSGGILISFPGKLFLDKANEILMKYVDKLKLTIYIIPPNCNCKLKSKISIVPFRILPWLKSY